MTDDIHALPQDIVEYIDRCLAGPHGESYLIPVLQQVQNRFGYLPRPLMDEVAHRMRIPTAKVTGVATFYHFFSFTPRGKHRVTVCMGTACFVRGAGKILDRLKDLLGVAEGETTADGLFTLESARCLGTCALAPVVVVDDALHGNVTTGDLEKILKPYGFKGKGETG
ncbi:MAG: NAD(P)H-dependent oxidoreductase subunit E [Lentisphaerae bacterium]|nr:NAD(P)H-dependent oxidoreductase subunit E [Lentisphaerota bacterium]